MKLVSSGNRGLWSVHTYDKICIETSWLDTGNLWCDFNLCTFDISPCSCKHLGIQALLVMALPVTCIILVTGWSRLHKGFSLLVLVCWEVCALVPHQIDLSFLGVTCHLLDVLGGHLWTLHFLCNLPDLACGKLVQVYVTVINCLGDKFLNFQEKPKDVPLKDLGCFWGILSQSNLGLCCIVPFINWVVSLESCKQVKSSPDFIRLGLAKLFKFLPYGI